MDASSTDAGPVEAAPDGSDRAPGAARAARLARPPFGLADLAALTRRVAAEVRAGRREVSIDADRRWYRLLRGDDLIGIWLISWATEQTVDLHDPPLPSAP